MNFFIKRRLVLGLARDRGVIKVAKNGQQPDASIIAFKAVERLKGPEKSFLGQVFRVVRVASKPACQVESGVHVAKNQPLEFLELFLMIHINQPGARSCQNSFAALLFPGKMCKSDSRCWRQCPEVSDFTGKTRPGMLRK